MSGDTVYNRPACISTIDMVTTRHGQQRPQADRIERECDDCGKALSYYNRHRLCYTCQDKEPHL